MIIKEIKRNFIYDITGSIYEEMRFKMRSGRCKSAGHTKNSMKNITGRRNNIRETWHLQKQKIAYVA